MSNEGEWGYEDWNQPREGDQPKWLPSDEEIRASIEGTEMEYDTEIGVFTDVNLEPMRAVIRAAVEKALDEQWQENLNAKEELIRRFRELSDQQEARHRREVIEARIEEVKYAISNRLRGTPSWLTDRKNALRDELAALDKEARDA